MQAMNGFAVRRFARLLGCVVALLALSAMTVPSLASAKPKIKQSILGLGDSLAFGYSQQVFNENILVGDPASAFSGWVEDYAENPKAKPAMSETINDGCPGETTSSMIGEGALQVALTGAIPPAKDEKGNEYKVTGESPCAYHKKGFPLHHEYGGKSQLESALESLAVQSFIGHPVKKITLNIGNNDGLHFIAKVEKEAKEYAEAQVLGKLIANASAFLKSAEEPPVKEKANEYAMEQCAKKYNPETEFSAWKACVESGQFQVQYVIGYWKATSDPRYTGPVSEGPAIGEKKGHELIAAGLEGEITQQQENTGAIIYTLRHASAFTEGAAPDFTGKLIVHLPYDPYGEVFVPGTELQPGFKELVGLGNLFTAKTVHSFNANPKKNAPNCTFNSENTWNPGGKKEVERLQAWTNMANMTTWEDPNKVVLKYGQKDPPYTANGPDIHPTPVGYLQMANEAVATCK